jgi:hypothetical protein
VFGEQLWMNQKQKISRPPKIVTSNVEKTLQHVAAPELGLVESELGAQGHSRVKAAAQRHQRDQAENWSLVGTGYQVPALLLLSTYLLQD